MTIQKVANFFNEEGYRWKFKDGSYRVPTEDEIDLTVMLAMDALDNEPDNAQVEVGRLIVKRRKQGQYDVFVLISELMEDVRQHQ